MANVSSLQNLGDEGYCRIPTGWRWLCRIQIPNSGANIGDVVICNSNITVYFEVENTKKKETFL